MNDRVMHAAEFNEKNFRRELFWQECFIKGSAKTKSGAGKIRLVAAVENYRNNSGDETGTRTLSSSTEPRAFSVRQAMRLHAFGHSSRGLFSLVAQQSTRRPTRRRRFRLG